MLLIITGLSLVVGSIASLADAPQFAHSVWIIGGISGLFPSLAWVIRAIKERELGTDFLALIALVGTLLTEEYFASAVIALMLATGSKLEEWAEGQAKRQLESLLKRMPRHAFRIDGDGLIENISIDEISIGDRIFVKSGEILPTDGSLLTEAELDESALTGEPLPVQRMNGEPVSSGVVNVGNSIEFVATSTAGQSTYAGIIRLVEGAQANSAPTVRMANIFGVRFLGIALLLAGFAWVVTGDSKRAIAVLVTATPCPLILAVPIAIVSGMSLTARSGAVIKNGGILEALSRAQVVLLDKTGTLTHGGPAISNITMLPGSDIDRTIQYLSSLEQHSPHIVAQTLLREAANRELLLLPASEIREEHGVGIVGYVDGHQIRAGQLLEKRPAWAVPAFPLEVAVHIDGVLVSVIGLSDPIREESKKVIGDLHKHGVERILLVTGDREETARDVAEEVGISEVHSNVSAAGKMALVESMMRESKGTVIVVGDGINDAPALAAAHVGVAMGARGASAASEAADVVIVEDSLARLSDAIAIAKNSRKKALEASTIGMSLSGVAMVAAALGFINPSEGALGQEFIDLLAILWALTALRRI